MGGVKLIWVPIPVGRETREATGSWGRGGRGRAPWVPTSPSPWAGLLLQEMTMAGLHELRFTEEKPLLRGQDAELVSPVTVVAPAPARGMPGRGCLSGSLVGGVLVLGAHVCTCRLVSNACVCRCVLVLMDVHGRAQVLVWHGDVPM